MAGTTRRGAPKGAARKQAAGKPKAAPAKPPAGAARPKAGKARPKADEPRSARARAEAGERRLLKAAAWMMDRGQPFTHGDLVDAFPDDYAGKAQAVEKMINRDKAALLRLGLALRHAEDEQTKYLVDRSALHLPPLPFERAEAAVVWMAGMAALRAGDHPLGEELESALRKLTVGARGLPEVPPGPEPLTPPPAGEALAEVLHTLAEAIQERRRLHLVYRGGAEGTETIRDVDVWGYGLRRGEWFFVGRCHLRDEARLFYARRVVSLTDKARPADHACAVSAAYKGGDYQVPPGFDLETWRLQQPWDYLAHPPVEVVVRLGGALGRAARTLLPGKTFRLADDGRREAAFTVRNLDGLVRQLLAWGPDAELVSPPGGRAQARAALERLEAGLAGEVAP